MVIRAFCSFFFVHLVVLSLACVTGLTPGICRLDSTSNNLKFTPRSILLRLRKDNCTTLIGNLRVNSFGAMDSGNNEHVRSKDLEVLRQLEYIYFGDVELELSHYPDIKNLSFFANLKIIRATSSTFSLRNSSLTSLFPPAYSIFTESIELIDNKNLCYLENFKSHGRLTQRGNKNFTDCEQAGAVCYPGCNGCFGPGNDLCIKCNPGYWKSVGNISDYMTCEQCDPECSDCSSAGRTTSTCTCKHKTYDNVCVSKCPNETMLLKNNCLSCTGFDGLSPVYNIVQSGFKTCKFCDKNCIEGCSNGSSKDCFKCRDFKYFHEKSTKARFQCVTKCPSTNGYRIDTVTGERICNKGSHANQFSSIVLLFIAVSPALTFKLLH